MVVGWCVVGGGLGAKYLIPCCCIRYSFYLDMQNDHVLKKVEFDHLTPGVGGVCRKFVTTMLLHL